MLKALASACGLAFVLSSWWACVGWMLGGGDFLSAGDGPLLIRVELSGSLTFLALVITTGNVIDGWLPLAPKTLPPMTATAATAAVRWRLAIYPLRLLPWGFAFGAMALVRALAPLFRREALGLYIALVALVVGVLTFVERYDRQP